MSAPTGPAPAGTRRPALAGRLREAGRAVRWYWRGMTGADAYDRYVDYLRRRRPDAPVPSEREFWAQKYDDMERHPATRCC